MGYTNKNPVSKRSRAARRGLIDEEGEAKELKNVPKPEMDDVRKSIIRTTIKNENLLAKKMENLKIKKTNKKKTNNLKSKLERSSKLDGVLSSKIEQSIARAKYIQALRKAGWDQINSNITITNNMVDTHVPQEKSDAQVEKEAEDEYVNQFFNEEPKEKTPTYVKSSANRFALLEEEES